MNLKRALTTLILMVTSLTACIEPNPDYLTFDDWTNRVSVLCPQSDILRYCDLTTETRELSLRKNTKGTYGFYHECSFKGRERVFSAATETSGYNYPNDPTGEHRTYTVLGYTEQGNLEPMVVCNRHLHITLFSDEL